MQKSVLTVDRFEIPYMLFGEGPHLLICVNGMQQTMASWRSLVRHFAGTSYRVALFDFPNQGRARCLHGSACVGILEQVGVLGAVADTLSPDEPVALIGGSWGAVVAAAYAARRPPRVRRLVLGSFQVRPNARLREVARLGRSLVAAGRGDELGEVFVGTFGAHLPPPRQRSIVAQFAALRAEQFQQMFEHAERLVNEEDVDSVADLRAIHAETLIVNGGADPIVDAVDTETLRRIPGAELRVVANVGHFLHVEQPAILETYAEFLHRDLPDGAAAGSAANDDRQGVRSASLA
jgi:pimeloyl-ACP methyl ester carboxylesterase